MFVLITVVAVLSLVLTAVVSGVFFAYSNSVLPGLDAVEPGAAIDAMSSMNRAIINPMFLLSFLGPPVTALAAGILIMVDGGMAGGLLFLAAAVVYLLGCVVTTARVNVPMNNALDAAPAPADGDEATRVWTGFSIRWTRWNNWRAGLSLVAVALSGIGLLVWGHAA